MIHKTMLLDNLLGQGIVDALIETLYNQVSDFPDTYQQYQSAIQKLHSLPGTETPRFGKTYAAAIEQRCAALLTYAGAQGLKMNYEHFHNPLLPTCVWPQIDFDAFLSIDQAYSMPLYQTASVYNHDFRKRIPEEISDAIMDYESAIEVYGTKLAHFYGYLLGNDLLMHCVPGYRPDNCLKFRYQHLLEEYFGCPLNFDQWDGFINVVTWQSAPITPTDPQETIIYREEIRKHATLQKS